MNNVILPLNSMSKRWRRNGKQCRLGAGTSSQIISKTGTSGLIFVSYWSRLYRKNIDQLCKWSKTVCLNRKSMDLRKFKNCDSSQLIPTKMHNVLLISLFLSHSPTSWVFLTDDPSLVECAIRSVFRFLLQTITVINEKSWLLLANIKFY